MKITMKNKILKIAVLLFPFIIVSCDKESIKKDIHFSILGDSFSTFEGFVTPESNDVWYKLPPNNYIDVTDVSQMWWSRIQNTMNWKLERNNSFSGSVLCNYDTTNYYGPHSFIRRADDLGNPDVVFVFGGTNDLWQNAPLGDFQYEDWTDEDLCFFRPGLAFLCQKLKITYPAATICFMIDMQLGQEIVDSFHTIIAHYQVNYIDLYGIDKDWDHPTVFGMKSIADQTIAAIRK